MSLCVTLYLAEVFFYFPNLVNSLLTMVSTETCQVWKALHVIPGSVLMRALKIAL